MQFKPKAEKPKIDVAIDNLLDELNEYPGYDEDYAKRVKMLEKLHKIKNGKVRDQPSSDTLLTVGGNVLIALIIVAFEREHVITTKLTSFLAKVR